MSQEPRLDQIFERALGMVDPAARAAYLDEACGGNAALREQACLLLGAHHAAEGLMDTLADPVWGEVVALIYDSP